MPITKTEKIWMDGELVDWDDARIHILTHTLHYGCGVFEGIRAYPTDAGPAVFRLTDHIERLFNSAKIFMIDVPFSPEEIVEATKTTVRVNGLPECYIRPIVYLGYGEMGLNPLPCPVNVSIAVWPWGAYLGDEGMAKGVRMKISSWQRHDPNAMPPAAKGTGMYINSSMAKIEALKAGYDEAILLSPQGYVSRMHRGKHLRRAERPHHHPAPVGRRPGGHHPGLGAHHRPGPRLRRRDRPPPALGPLHRRRGVPLRDRSRGGADRLGRRPGRRRRHARPDHPADPGGLPRRRARRGGQLQGLGRTCRVLCFRRLAAG